MRLGQVGSFSDSMNIRKALNSRAKETVAPIFGTAGDKFQIRFGGGLSVPDDLGELAAVEHQDWLARVLGIHQQSWATKTRFQRDSLLEDTTNTVYREAQAELLGIPAEKLTSDEGIFAYPYFEIAERLGMDWQTADEEQVYEVLAQKTLDKLLERLDIKEPGEASKVRKFFADIFGGGGSGS